MQFETIFGTFTIKFHYKIDSCLLFLYKNTKIHSPQGRNTKTFQVNRRKIPDYKLTRCISGKFTETLHIEIFQIKFMMENKSKLINAFLLYI